MTRTRLLSAVVATATMLTFPTAALAADETVDLGLCTVHGGGWTVAAWMDVAVTVANPTLTDKDAEKLLRASDITLVVDSVEVADAEQYAQVGLVTLPGGGTTSAVVWSYDIGMLEPGATAVVVFDWDVTRKVKLTDKSTVEAQQLFGGTCAITAMAPAG